MTVKQKLYALLQAHKEQYLSGETLAAQLGVSRASVWKAVQALRAEGCEIHAVTNRGYCLSGCTDLLAADAITAALSPAAAQILSVQVQNTVTSTNQIMRQQAADGAPEGTVLLAGTQTAGRGRLGRNFFSPADSGLYLSLLLRPDCPADRAVFITTTAAVAVCEAIEQLTGLAPGIKWVNDIFLSGKKICGILTEASLDLESSRLEYAVLGIGINVYAPTDGFPEGLETIAGALLDARRDGFRNQLAAAILSRFWERYATHETTLDAYRDRSLALGRQISVLRAGVACPAEAVDITPDCALRVRYPDGREEVLSSGEISIRL